MSNESTKAAIAVSNLLALKECGLEKYYFEKLNLKDKDSERLGVLRMGCQCVAKSLQKCENVHDAINLFVKEDISPEWFNLKLQYEAVVSRVRGILMRLGDYLLQHKLKRKALSNVSYSISFNNPISYRGITFSQIKGVCDLVLIDDDKVEGICFCSGEPVESERARKEENLPKNSLKIACMYAGLKNLYPDKEITAALYYLKSKDDKGGKLAEFEGKKGKNIVSVTYADEEPLAEITRAANFLKCGDCSNCYLEPVCRVNTCVRTNVTTCTDETNIEPAKKTFVPSDAQSAVINHIDGPMLVEAVPGAGKTASLVERMVKMVGSGIRASNILAISFTKKAVGELTQRLEQALVNKDLLPVVDTFNSFGYKIIRENPNIFANVKLASDTDKKRLIELSIKESVDAGIIIDNISYYALHGDYGTVNLLFGLFEQIEQGGKDNFRTIYKGKKDVDNIVSVYDIYSNMFLSNGYIGYDDQINLVVDMFEKYPDILSRYQELYKYIMIDEFQDINDSQFKLIYLLSKKYKNLVCVGDCDQAIYGFRGGTVKYALHFSDYFPNAKTVFMEDNYRCTDSIVNAANALIKNNGDERYDKEIIPHKEGVTPFFYDGLPCDGVSRLIQNLSGKYEPGRIAVIARKHKLLKKFAESLGSTDLVSNCLIEDNVFQSILDIFTLQYSGLDMDKSLYRLLRMAGASVDDIYKDNDELSLYANLSGNDLIPSLELSFSEPVFTNDCLWNAGVRIAKALRSVVFSDFKTMLNSIVFELFGLETHPAVDVLMELFDERLIDTAYSAFSFMKEMLLYKDSKKVDYEADISHLNFLTAHSSKGKEFDCVIIYGVDEFLPTAEDRRLLYVALTRAKETLIVIKNAVADDMLEEFRPCLKQLVMKG